MSSVEVTLTPFTTKHTIPAMGTSGVRLLQEIFNRPHFLEQFIQGIADHLVTLDPELRRSCENRLILGGDPRLGNYDRILRAAEIFAANGFTCFIAEPSGVATTPAISHAIRHVKALAGIVFTASHNPYTDVGIKVNQHDGSPALEEMARAIHAAQNSVELSSFRSLPIEVCRARSLARPLDLVGLYGDLLDHIFDFGDLRRELVLFEQRQKRPFQIVLDSMGGAAGPFAEHIFVQRLGLKPELYRCKPDPYLGGPPEHPNHPEPDYDYIPYLLDKNATGKYDLVAAYDSDGDRRLDGGGGFWVESADEFALFARYLDLAKIPELFDERGKEIIFARSAVTAPAVDLLEEELRELYAPRGYSVRILETATGFKWIAEYGNWGVEESNGLGNPYLREKDGIFSTVFLLKVLLKSGKSLGDLLEELWQSAGRSYFTRGEITRTHSLRPDAAGFFAEGEELSAEKERISSLLDEAIASPPIGKIFAGLALEGAESWSYVDLEGRVREKSAVRHFRFAEGISARMRFSGTGSGGYTLRIYLTRYDRNFRTPKREILESAKAAVAAFVASIGVPVAPSSWIDTNQPEPYS